MNNTEQTMGASLVKAHIMCSTLQIEIARLQSDNARLQNDNARLQEIMKCDARRMVLLQEEIEAAT